MIDILSPEQRSLNMSRIKGKNTGPEMIIRRWLWANGYRYRIHKKDLPGKPDIVLPSYRAVILVHGCFWHRHGCKATTTPQSRPEFWISKFQENISRDKRNVEALLNKSWRVLTIWECMLRGKKTDLDFVYKEISAFLKSDIRLAECG